MYALKDHPILHGVRPSMNTVVGRAAGQLLTASVADASLESFSLLEVHVVTEDRRSQRLNRLTGGTAS